MSQEYVETRDDGYYVAGSRVSLDSIVYAFLAGQSAEAIGQVSLYDSRAGLRCTDVLPRAPGGRRRISGGSTERHRGEAAGSTRGRPDVLPEDRGGAPHGYRLLTMVRFQADADLNQIIVAALVRRAPGVDFRTAEIRDSRDCLIATSWPSPLAMSGSSSHTTPG